ncbi:hypothetical protein HMPREF0043_01287, partial [Actinobaculum sp. oral taxon 183 str. F0552]
MGPAEIRPGPLRRRGGSGFGLRAECTGGWRSDSPLPVHDSGGASG